MSEPVNNDESPAPVSEPVDPAPTTPAVAPEAVNNSTEENIGDDQPKSDNPTPPPPLSGKNLIIDKPPSTNFSIALYSLATLFSSSWIIFWS